MHYYAPPHFADVNQAATVRQQLKMFKLLRHTMIRTTGFAQSRWHVAGYSPRLEVALPCNSSSLGQLTALGPSRDRAALTGAGKPGQLALGRGLPKLHSLWAPTQARQCNPVDTHETGRQEMRARQKGMANLKRKSSIPFSIFACHPCAGAMLIFSVSFQF